MRFFLRTLMIFALALPPSLPVASRVNAQTTPPNRSGEKEDAPTPHQLQSLANLRLLQRAVGLGGVMRSAWDEAVRRKDTPDARADKVIEALLKASGLTITDLNQARARTAASAANPATSPISLETVVLNDIAEFAFDLKDTAIIATAKKRGVDFSQSDVAALRARQAGQSPLGVARMLTDAVAASPSLIKEARLTDGMDNLLISRIARRRLKEADAGKTNLSPEAKGALRSLALSYPTAAPTPPKMQGKTGRYDRSNSRYYAPAPDKVPTLTPGQKFLSVMEDKIELRDDRTNQPIPRKDAVFRVLTLQKIDHQGENDAGEMLRLTFALTGYPTPVVWAGAGGLYDLPGIFPLSDDDNVRFLRRTYLGKTVWGYGGFGVAGITGDGNGASFGYDAETPVIVKGIYRIRGGYPREIALGTSPGYIGERRSVVMTNDPLLIELQISSHAKPTGAAFAGTTTPNANGRGFTYPHPLAYYARFADIWDFEREFTLTGLAQVSKRWPAPLRRAARNGELAKGMTPEMAAFVSGWPNEYGTRAELIRRTTGAAKATWEYDSLNPFHFYIYFKNGRVTQWGDDGH